MSFASSGSLRAKVKRCRLLGKEGNSDRKPLRIYQFISCMCEKLIAPTQEKKKHSLLVGVSVSHIQQLLYISRCCCTYISRCHYVLVGVTRRAPGLFLSSYQNRRRGLIRLYVCAFIVPVVFMSREKEIIWIQEEWAPADVTRNKHREWARLHGNRGMG